MSEMVKGKREHAKAEKMSRILAASSHLFSEQGFEKTTIQQIASKAEVATGTVFLYATDKSELILLLYENAVSELLPSAAREMTGDDRLDREIVAFFSPFFNLFLHDEKLGRVIYRELLFPEGPIAEKLDGQKERVLQILKKRIALEIGPQDPRKRDSAAEQIYTLYHAALGQKLSNLSPEIDAVSLFRSLVKNHLKGINEPPAEMVKVRKKLKLFKGLVLVSEEQGRVPVM